jgi:gliding motility-associatede transport system auxiliary component
VSVLKAWIGPLSVACLVGAGALYLFFTWLERLRWALVIAGILALVLAVALNARELGAVLGRRSARYGLGLGVTALLALAVLVFANAVSFRHSARWDLTENRRHSLSPQTLKILKGLTMPVQAIAFPRTDTTSKQKTEDLLKLYAADSNGKFTWRVEDPDRSPGLARRYGIETYGTVVLERAGKGEARSEKVVDAEEEKVTNGLVKLTRDAKRVIYVLKGHGELDPASAERPGMSQAKEQMEKVNYEVRELILAREAKVPAEAAIVVVPGPKTDLLAPELEALDAFIARGGKVFFMLAPFQADGLAKHLARYGLEVADDLVIETNPVGRLFNVGPEVPVVTQYEGHPITRELGNTMTFFPLTRSIEPAKAPPKGIVVQALARTSAQSWGETDRAALQRGEVQFDGKDRKGPLPVAVVATIDATAAPAPAGKAEGPGKGEATAKAEAGGKTDGGEPKPARARIVVIGTANLASNQFIAAQGNRDFFLNVISWLAEEEDLLSIRPRESAAAPIILTAAQSQMVFWLPVVVLPLAIVVSGIVVRVRRRRAG